MNNLNNQGLSEVTVTSGTVKYKTGKIGQGFDLNSKVMFNCPDLSGCKKFTICFWAKIEDDANITTNWGDIIGFTDQKADNSSTGQFRAETHYTAAATDPLRYIHWHDNATNAISEFVVYHTIAGDTQRSIWHHCAIAVDADTGVWAYTDGNPKSPSGAVTMNGGHLTGQFWLGETNKIQGVINDVRVYKDEILSPKVIKEISKGLVCHYTLSNGGGENMLRNTNTGSTYWYWSGNGGTRTATATEDGGVKLTAVTAANSGSWSVIQYNDPNFKTLLKPSTTYTASLDIYPPYSTSTFRFSIKDDNASNSLVVSEPDCAIEKDKWNHCVWTFTTKDTLTMSRQIVYMTGIPSTIQGYEIYLKNIKVEEGSEFTPWTPAPTDALYTKMGLNDSIEYDVSGYRRNGTKYDSFKYTTDTPRYITAIEKTDNTKPAIQIPTIWEIGTTVNELTLSCWHKTNTANNSTKNIINLHGNAFLRFGLNTSSALWVYGNSSGINGNYTLPSPGTDNKWHLYTLTFKDGILKAYFDGEIVGTKDVSSTTQHLTVSANPSFIGAYLATGSEITPGSFSDARIYATALSADDILALYNIPISLTSNGTLLTQGELTEV